MNFDFLAPLMPKILLFLKPIVIWFDKVFTIPFSIKKIDADLYYLWRDRFKAGMVFVSDTYGQGSNLLNPSKGKHGCIYFGTGLKTHLTELIDAHNRKEIELPEHLIDFCHKHLDGIKDEIEYVIEALGSGVTATSVTKFLTTKDVIRAYYPNFCIETAMFQSAKNACLDLGLPYDFAFNGADDSKYCFEVVIDAYLKEFPEVTFKMDKFFGYEVITSNAFEDKLKWVKQIDSKHEFPELYK
jgi:hypothetical protein